MSRLASGPLARRPFRLLLTGITAQALGASITPVALAFAVLGLGGSATQLGLVVAAFAAAEVVTLLFGGVLGDRVRRQVMMQGASGATAITQLTLGVLLLGGWATIWLVGAVGMVNGCIGALSGPSSHAMTRQTVPEAELPSAVALRRLSSQTAQVVGYAAAGMVVATYSPGWALVVVSVAYAVASFTFGRIRVEGYARTSAPASVRGDLVDGLREVLRHTWLWLLILQALLYHLFYGGVQGVLGPVVVEDVWDEAAWGWALAALMAGFIAGGLLCLRWRPRRALLVGALLLSLTGLFPLAIAFSESLVVLLLAAALHGFGLEVFSISWDLSIQQNVPEEKLARVYAFDMVGSFVARPLGLAVAGPLSAFFGMTEWLVTIAVVMAGSALVSSLAPSVRRLRRTSPVAA